MICAWKALIAVLPLWIRKEIERWESFDLRELRLRIDAPAELVFSQNSQWLDRCITQEDLNYIINTSSQYSPWAVPSKEKGYITITGGHRIGICGESVIQQGRIVGFRQVSSLCIRIARDFPGIASSLKKIRDSVIILGPPGWGKTTLLRDLVRQLSEAEQISVVDERGELFPLGFSKGKRVDVLTGCSKPLGVSMLLRTMGPNCIAVDEITDPEDSQALLEASNCGVRLLATAHAASISDFQERNAYRLLLENHVFQLALILNKDQTYTMERMTGWKSNGLVRY